MGVYLATDASKTYSIKQRGETMEVGNRLKLGMNIDRLIHMVSHMYNIY